MLIKTEQGYAQMVRAERVASNLTQREVAAETGMSLRWLQGVESGEISPTLSAAIKLASALGLELHLEKQRHYPEIDAVFEELQ